MNDSHIVNLRQVEENIAVLSSPIFSFETHQAAYAWIDEILDRFLYFKKGRLKKEKNSIRRYIKQYTAYSKSQITRLIKEKKKAGTLKYGKGKKRHKFKKEYTEKDIELLAEADNFYRRMSGDAMRGVFKDEYVLYGKEDYKRLSRISHGQLYRLRGTGRYGEHSVTVGRTMTPCQKLLSIPNVETYLREGVTVSDLKAKMLRMSHLTYTKIMHEEKQKLFAAIKKC